MKGGRRKEAINKTALVYTVVIANARAHRDYIAFLRMTFATERGTAHFSSWTCILLQSALGSFIAITVYDFVFEEG